MDDVILGCYEKAIILEDIHMKKQNTICWRAGIDVTLAVCFIYMVSRLTELYEHPIIIQIAMVAALLGCCLYIWRKKPDEKKICTILIIMGIVMRIGYMLYTGCEERQHDLWDLDKSGYGHAAYLLTLIEDRHLPETNQVQMYQQPMFYFLGAGISGFINWILGSKEAYFLVDAAKTVSCAASCICLLLCRRIGILCGLREKEMKYALMLTAFLPAFYIAGGTISPDALVAMFMLLAFALTLQWFKDPGWLNTVLLAVVYGLGVLTKISCGVVALMTAVLFVWKFITQIKAGIKTAGMLVCKYVVFGLIALPLGLWYSVRNYLLFGQPLNYVLPISEDSWLYRGNCSVVERLFLVQISNFFGTPYVDLNTDYNAPAYYLKSSLFNEFRYNVPGWIPVVLLMCAAICAAACLMALIWQIMRNRKDFYCSIVAGMSVLYYASILFFYLQYPFACSMDFRYMLFLVIPFSILLGKYIQYHEKTAAWIRTGLWGLAVSSCVMYVLAAHR